MAEVTNNTMRCLQERIDQKLPQALSNEFLSGLQPDEIPTSELIPSVSIGDRVSIAGGAIAGVATITLAPVIVKMIMKQLPESLVKSLGKKALSKVIGRVVPGLGAILVARDLWDVAQGVAPAVESTLKRDAPRIIRDSIEAEIQRVLDSELTMIAGAVADRGYSDYLDYLEARKDTIWLSEQSEAFHGFLNDDVEENVGKVSELVRVLLFAMGPERTIEVAESGVIEELYRLPRRSFEILEVREPEEAIAWADLVGSDDMLVQIVKNRYFVAASPEQFENREHLRGLLALDLEPRDLRGIVLLPFDHQRQLYASLPVEDAREIVAISGDHDDLPWLLGLLAELTPTSANNLVFRLLNDSSVLRKINGESVRDVLKSSSDFERHLDYLQQPAGAVGHTLRVVAGDVPIGLVPKSDERIWMVVVVSVVIVAFLVLLLVIAVRSR